MSNSDIEEQIRELYNFNISTSTISRITDKITEDVIAWRNRKNESSAFWMSVLTDIKARGTQDILITATDNLNGFTDTIKTIFPNSTTQICVVHQIRNSCRYVVWKDKKEFTRDMKQIYTANTRKTNAPFQQMRQL